MEKGPYYCKNLTNRILKSFSDRVTKQLGWNEVRSFSIKIDFIEIEPENCHIFSVANEWL